MQVFYLYNKVGGGAETVLAMLMGSTKSLGVVLTQELEVLSILKGGHCNFPPFKRGLKGLTPS